MADAVIEANQGEILSTPDSESNSESDSDSVVDDSLEGNEFAPEKEALDDRQF